MDGHVATLTRFLEAFNAGDVNAMAGMTHQDADFADEIDGGRIVGRDALRHHWTRIQDLMRAEITPFAFEVQADESIIVRARHHVTSQQFKFWSEGETRLRFVFRDNLIWNMERALGPAPT